MPALPHLRTVLPLGLAQTLAWASSYYLPAALGAAIARDLQLGLPLIYACFSAALVVTALVGPRTGRLIDQLGGRPVLLASNLVLALGLALLALSQGLVSLVAAWLVLGLGMGLGLYEAAFATLVRLHGSAARTPITGITLIAGFASTVGWPVSAALDAHWGWRSACWAWAAAQLLLALPLNACLPGLPATPQASDAGDSTARPDPAPGQSSQSSQAGAGTAQAATPSSAPVPLRVRSEFWLASSFALSLFISGALAAHLPQLLQACGASLGAAVAAAALMGPAQVAARLLEFGILRRVHPLRPARLGAMAHPLGALTLIIGGPLLTPLFTVLHGMGNGVLTISRGALPLALYGPAGYGERQGQLMLGGRISQALAPWLFGLALSHWGAQTLWLSAALSLASLGCLMMLRE